MDRAALPPVPLQLTSLAVLSPSNAPLFVRSFTGRQDELRHYHLAHAAVDVIEERSSFTVVMTTTPNRPADTYLGLLFCMEDMAFYGFQTPTKIRMVLSVALVDATIKDADIVAIFRAVHHLLLQTTHDPFLSLAPTFRAAPATPAADAGHATADAARPRNEPTPDGDMFATGPERVRPDWLERSAAFQRGVERIGTLLNGGRA